MEFKIDTKANYTVLRVQHEVLNANLTDAIRQKWNELTESGSSNLIIDLSECVEYNEPVFEQLIELHEDFYSKKQSLVFSNLPNDILKALKKNETDLLLNIAPTEKEAIDIISMEILERDLFNEES